jgi:hypothetical protein
MNTNIDINHIYNGGVKLPDNVGMALFFGDSE